MLLPRRLVVERSFAWATHVHRPARDHARLSQTVAGQYVVAFSGLMLHFLLTVAAESPLRALGDKGPNPKLVSRTPS